MVEYVVLHGDKSKYKKMTFSGHYIGENGLQEVDRQAVFNFVDYDVIRSVDIVDETGDLKRGQSIAPTAVHSTRTLIVNI